MPFCVQCGNQVSDSDRFCGRCGSNQPSASGGAGPKTPGFSGLPNIDAHTASIFCYIPLVGWVASILVLASQKYRHDTTARFHAFQGLYLFVAWLVVDWVVSPLVHVPGVFIGMGIGRLLKLVIMGAWIWMLLKVIQRENFKLPLVGEWAEKSVAEQR
jgi:uncharacterized membrane protein